MEKADVVFYLVVYVLLFSVSNGGLKANAVGTEDGSETWGYVQVRPKAHMFWWLYESPCRTQNPTKPWPVILWLQGGPGGSGVGIGNFEEIGPLDTYLKPRNSTWLKKADLMFVDNPVGTGYSYVEDTKLLVKSDDEAAADLTTLLIEISNRNVNLQKSPLYIVAESYGGKYAVTLGLSALGAIEDGKLKLKLGVSNGGLKANAVGTEDGSETWGYVQVRPKAHMFWWLYESPCRTQNPTKPWPVILWLQGGPGGSGVGIGNFEEIGPLDTYLKPRNSTWLKKADLMFVDNPVGTGYSYVEDTKLLVKSDDEAAADLTTLLIEISNRNVNLQKSPLYIVAESYGGKYAVTLGLSALGAIEDGKLKLKLGGIALGDSWISPEDFVLSWGPLLKDVSRLDKKGLVKSNRLANEIKQQIKDHKYVEATYSWNNLEYAIFNSSNGVDFYNFMLDLWMDDLASSTAAESSQLQTSMKRYSTYLSSLQSSPGGDGDRLDSIMNGEIKNKLHIIPENVTWGGQGEQVFDAFEGDFMRPRIKEVDQLLAKGVHVTIYSGQLDVICSTIGTEAWVSKLKWGGLKTFLAMDRTPIYCGKEKITKGFTKSYRNLQFYWILRAGHFVPVDQPCVALNMIANITQT